MQIIGCDHFLFIIVYTFYLLASAPHAWFLDNEFKTNHTMWPTNNNNFALICLFVALFDASVSLKELVD